jgi:hypothetical protein
MLRLAEVGVGERRQKGVTIHTALGGGYPQRARLQSIRNEANE